MKYLDTNFGRSSIGYLNTNKFYYSFRKKRLRRNYRIKRQRRNRSLSILNIAIALTILSSILFMGSAIFLINSMLDFCEKDPIIQREIIIINDQEELITDKTQDKCIQQSIPDNLYDEIEILECLKKQENESIISINNYELTKMDLPSKYYGNNCDYSYFQPYMSYEKVTNETAPSYKITKSSSNSYTDNNGFRRYKTNSNVQFTVNGEDDYIVALGTFYKEKGTAGERFLVTTEKGMFTIITGDEKADCDTDPMNMFTVHGDGKYFGLIEWIVDTEKIDESIISNGTITAGTMEDLHGEITGIYKIS